MVQVCADKSRAGLRTLRPGAFAGSPTRVIGRH
jgi:hypothetical protein